MYVGVLRRVMVCVGVCVLLCVCVRYRDPVQQSLQVLQQLRETQRNLQEALQHAGESAGRSPGSLLRAEPGELKALIHFNTAVSVCLSVCLSACLSAECLGEGQKKTEDQLDVKVNLSHPSHLYLLHHCKNKLPVMSQRLLPISSAQPIKCLPEEISEQKKRGDAEEEKEDKKRRGGGGGGGVHHVGASDHRRLRPVSPLTHRSVLVSFLCPHTFVHVVQLCISTAGWSTDSILSSTVNSSAADVTLLPHITQNASVSPDKRPRRSLSSRLLSSSSSSPLVYSILVEDKQVINKLINK